MRNIIRAMSFWLGTLLLAVPLTTVNAAEVLSRGVMIHFLPLKGAANDRMARIDAESLVNQINQLGAKHLIFTLGQNKGQYNIPMPILEKFCPDYSRVDVDADHLMELARKLRANRIALILYLPFRAPQFDKYLQDCLQDTPERRPTTAAFFSKWTEIVGEIGQRYGNEFAGWWFDGVYNTDGIDSAAWKSFCSAVNRGAASGRLLAFNSGEGYAVLGKRSAAPCQNWAAGELNSLDNFDMQKILSGTAQGLKIHVLTRIGNRWGAPGDPVLTCSDLRDAGEQLVKANGVLTVDVGFNESSGIVASQAKLLRQAWREGC